MHQDVKHTIKTNGSYYMTMTVVDWADVFTRKNQKQAIIESFRYCIKNKGRNVYAYCIMTNHLHVICNSDETFTLSDTIRDFKRRSAKTILNQIENEPVSRRENFQLLFRKATKNNSKSKNFKFWKTDNPAIKLNSEKFLWEKINYVHNHPVVEKFVAKPEHWLYSSASNYLDEESILAEVILVPQIMKTI